MSWVYEQHDVSGLHARRDSLGPAVAWLACGLSMLGCATAGTGSGNTAPDRPAPSELAALRAKVTEQHAAIEQLRGRLGMLEAEAREMRALLENREGKALRETVRIGSGQASDRRQSSTWARESNDWSSADAAQEQVVDERSVGPRPVLRLHGTSRRSHVSRSTGADMELPTVSERLPLAPVPRLDERSSTVSTATSGASVKNRDNSEHASDEHASDDALTQYRQALQDLRGKSYERALDNFTAFLVRHPSHAHADRAMYWRGETYYAKRAYREALREFEAVIARFPRSAMVPDALLKIGLAYRRLGKDDDAHRSFERLRTEFPDSKAADLASREGST